MICETKFCGILDIPLSSVNVESYICSDRCFRSLKGFQKLQEDPKTLHRTLKENFVRNNRVKRGVFSDSAISPSVAAQTKTLHHGEDQRRVKSAKSLSYGEISPKPNPADVKLVDRNVSGKLYTIWHYLLSTSFLACSQF